MENIGYADYTAIEKGLKSASVLRQEDVTVDDETSHCIVVEGTYPHRWTRTFWVDPTWHAVLGEVDLGPGHVERTIEVQKLDWNLRLPDSVFQQLHDSSSPSRRGNGPIE